VNANQNLFLTPSVLDACNDAGIYYIDVLVRQRWGMQPVDWLRRMMDQHRNNLDSYWQVALASATAGNVQDGSHLLACIIREWGIYTAFKDLVDADAQGVDLDPMDPYVRADLQRDFQMELNHRVTSLVTELTNAWSTGRAEREKKEQNELVQGYTNLHGMVMQMVQVQETNLQAAHRANKQYADAALQGIEQARQSVVHMYDFVVSTQSNVVGMQQAFQDHLQQNLPSYINDANQKRTFNTLGCFLGICVIIVVLFGSAVFIGTHLIGH
jgi:hypothetical protein